MKAVSLSLFLALIAGTSQAEQIIGQDFVVNGNACIGDDCVSGDAGGSPNLKLKSSSPFIVFEDTIPSSINSLDWRIGKNFNNLLIKPVSISNLFSFSEDGDFGIGTASPLQSLHIAKIDTPSIRLQQTNLGGNPPKIWDMGANDANFFIRDFDAKTLPFRIIPGAPTNALFVDANGQVGVGLQNPKGALHVRRNQPNNLPHLVLQNRREGGRTELWFQDRDTATDDDTLRLQLRGDDFNITFNGTGGSELQVSKTGDVRIFRGDLVIPNGGVIVGGKTLKVPDYVFADDYELMPLSDVSAFINEKSHLPHIPSAAEVAAHGLDLTAMQLAMLKSHEELVLHTLAQQSLIDAQREEIEGLKALAARVAELEQRVLPRE